jgi:Ca2+-transporting ATPase
VLTILLATELDFLKKFLGTVSLTGEQWLVCIGVALSLIVVEEAKKLLKIRTEDTSAAAAVTAPAAA